MRSAEEPRAHLSAEETRTPARSPIGPFLDPSAGAREPFLVRMDEVTKDFVSSREEAEALIETAHALLKVAPKNV